MIEVGAGRSANPLNSVLSSPTPRIPISRDGAFSVRHLELINRNRHRATEIAGAGKKIEG